MDISSISEENRLLQEKIRLLDEKLDQAKAEKQNSPISNYAPAASPITKPINLPRNLRDFINFDEYNISERIQDEMYRLLFNETESVPRFGYAFSEGKEPEIINRSYFNTRITDNRDDRNNKIVLITFDDSGNKRYITIPESYYKKVLISQAVLQEALLSSRSRERSQELVRIYNKEVNLDFWDFRYNTPEDFWHNYRNYVWREAYTYQDAMNLAAKLINTMSQSDKQEMLKSIENYKMFSFKGLILLTFKTIQAEKDITQNSKNISDFIDDKLIKGKTVDEYTLKDGDIIPGTHHKVGDIIPFSPLIKNWYGNWILLDERDFKIVQVTKGLKDNMALLFNEENKSFTTTSLSDLKSKIKKLERIQKRKERKEKRRLKRQKEAL